MKVEYVTHSGSDLLVVDAARASFGKQSQWDVQYEEVVDVDTRCISYFPIYSLSEKDTKLINYLAREHHFLPFRHPQVTLRCKAPIFVARQLGKYQVGFSWSEESRRYITTEPEFFYPDKWRKRAENVKQGSSDEEVGDDDWAYGLPSAISRHMSDAIYLYNDMLDSEVAPELARMILPQNMYTTWVWTGSLLGWVHIIKERTAPTAQRETKQFAEMVATQIKKLYPVSYRALMDN